mmetsp:Transcript_24467/g.52954  ORF Transcript_24467/g.52954 Transcript_24467/m.52954 type:complete len:124 (+) Transcript_24467:185-556(+)
MHTLLICSSIAHSNADISISARHRQPGFIQKCCTCRQMVRQLTAPGSQRQALAASRMTESQASLGRPTEEEAGSHLSPSPPPVHPTPLLFPTPLTFTSSLALPSPLYPLSSPAPRPQDELPYR